VPKHLLIQGTSNKAAHPSIQATIMLEPYHSDLDHNVAKQ